MIGADRGEACAHQRIGAGGINLQPLKPRRRTNRFKPELQTARFANPVGLHDPHFFGPVGQPVQRVQQLLRVIRNLEEPLRQLTPFNRSARPPALAVDHLLIGQNRHIDRVPVHHRILAIDQPRLHHVDEHGLLLAVILGVAGRKFARPVDRQAKRAHLPAHVGDVGIGPILGVAAAFHRGILGGHAERIPAHRVQHRKPLRCLIARNHIAHGIVAHMPHMDAA